MTKKKRIRFNAFDMNCVGHINHGLWTHPRDRSAHYRDLDYWTHLAKVLERGLFDGLFLADITGVYDVYRQSLDLPLREAVQLPVNDPLMLVSGMAGVTSHLGFGVTVNLSYEAPYLFARRMSTLDHLTKGRIAWNIVTGYLESAARGMGLPQQIAHDDRYDRADEFLEVVYKLWEGSWEEGAVQRDSGRRLFTDPSKVHRIDHQGAHYRVQGVHLSEPSPQRTPVLYQAGASARGQVFAGRHAECVFVTGATQEAVRQQVASLRESAVRAGRRADDIQIFLGVKAVVAETEKLAREKFAEYERYASPESALAHYSAGSGVDFGKYGLDEPIRYEKTNATESFMKAVAGGGSAWTVRKLLDGFTLGGRYPPLVGTAAQVADALQDWVAATGIDGFNLSRTVTPESFEDFVDQVVPELQTRGVYQTVYQPGTLREKLFDPGSAHLPARHIGAGFRRTAARDEDPAP